MARGGAQVVSRAWHGVPVAVPGPVERRWLPTPDTVAGAAALRVIAPAGVTGEAHPAAIRLQPRHN